MDIGIDVSGRMKAPGTIAGMFGVSGTHCERVGKITCVECGERYRVVDRKGAEKTVRRCVVGLIKGVDHVS